MAETRKIYCECCRRLFPPDAQEGRDYSYDSLGCPGCARGCEWELGFARKLAADVRAARKAVDAFGGVRPAHEPPKHGAPPWERDRWAALERLREAEERLAQHAPYLPPHYDVA